MTTNQDSSAHAPTPHTSCPCSTLSCHMVEVNVVIVIVGSVEPDGGAMSEEERLKSLRLRRV